MAQQEIRLDRGNSIAITLPNGVVLHVEATADTIDVVGPDGQCFYSEEYDYHDAKWNRVSPAPLDGHEGKCQCLECCMGRELAIAQHEAEVWDGQS
jgi:hypothetical protein